MLTSIIALASGIALWVLVQVVRNHRPSMFVAQASGALFDLGLQSMKFGSSLNKIYVKDCYTYYETNGRNANPYDLEIRFFLKAATDYPAFAEPAVMFDGFLVRSIHVVRSWREKKITAAAADDFIHKIKTFLVKGLKDLPMEDDMRIATEIQILEL